MKKILLLLAVVFLAGQAAFANPFDKFNTVMDAASAGQAKSYLKNLASDMSAVMNGGNYGVSAGLGLLNFNASARLNTVKVDNEIMRAEGTSQLLVPMVNASLGLPMGFELLGKYAYFYDSNIYGLGLKYYVYESEVMFIPSVTVQGVYTMTDIAAGTNKLSANNIALGAVATFPIPFVTPYAGVGYDRTEVKAKSSIHDGMTGSADGLSYSLGVSVSILVVNGNVGVTYTDGIPSYTFGLNIGF